MWSDSRWNEADWRGCAVRVGKVHDVETVEVQAGGGQRIAARIQEPASRAAADIFYPGAERGGPGDGAVRGQVGDTGVAGGFVEHERIENSVTVEITRSEKLFGR